MKNDRRPWTWDQVFGLVLLAIAFVECAIALLCAPEGRPHGVDFGIAFAATAGILVVLAIALIGASRPDPLRGGPTPSMRVLGFLMLVPATGLLLFVAVGMLEEIR